MNITTAGLLTPPPRTPRETSQIKSDQYDTVDVYQTSRTLGNGLAGLVTGAALDTFDATVQAPKLAWELAENLWQAETLGPNLKFLGTVAALTGAASAASIVAAPFHGGFKGADLAADEGFKSSELLRVDSAIPYADAIVSGKPEGRSLSNRWQSSLEELGDRKLEPGEKPFDVPVLSPVFSVVGGVVSAGISGTVGLVAGTAAGLLTTGKEALEGVRHGEVGRVLTAPLHTIAIPYGLVKEGLIESVPRGFSDGWKHGALRPIVETAKASTVLASEVLKEAWER